MKALSFYDKHGNVQEVTLDPSIYHEAHDNGISVGQLLERKYETNAEKYGSVMAQLAAGSGLIRSADLQYGFSSPTLADVFNGSAEMNAGVITRDAQPASRILFPAVFLQWIENNLVKDFTTQPQIFEQMIAISDSIAGPRFEQPIVDFSKPQGARSQGIAQGAAPANMMTITASDVARKIPTFSIGLEITEEALKATTLDFLALSLGRQVAAERDARVEGYISAMVAGDLDNLNQGALATETTTSFDALATGGIITQKAWVKYLFNNFRFRQISHIMCDVDTALKIEGRTGKPIITSDDPNSPRIDATFQLLNYKLSQVKMFVLSAGVVPASTVVGIDSRYAIRRVRNSEAEYQAAEQFVMKKTQQLRFDFGEIVYRLFDQAWDVMTIA
jgi:hypothetical protein